MVKVRIAWTWVDGVYRRRRSSRGDWNCATPRSSLLLKLIFECSETPSIGRAAKNEYYTFRTRCFEFNLIVFPQQITEAGPERQYAKSRIPQESYNVKIASILFLIYHCLYLNSLCRLYSSRVPTELVHASGLYRAALLLCQRRTSPPLLGRRFCLTPNRPPY